MSISSPLPSLLHSLEDVSVLDTPGIPLQHGLRTLLDGRAVDGLLRGSWLGHPVHPMLVETVLGAWTGVVVLDVLDDASTATKHLIELGLLVTPLALATGWADWSTRGPAGRRIGLLHAGSNAVGVFLFLGSYVRRRKINDRKAKLLAVAGLVAVAAGGALGGHLAYASKN